MRSRSRRRVVRIRPEWEKDAFEIDTPRDLIPRLMHCSGGQLIGFDEEGRIRARMLRHGYPFLMTVGPRGGNRRYYERARDMDFLTEVWLITLRWVMSGDVEHLPPLMQLAIEGKADGPDN